MNKILLTGATSFLGRHLLKRLREQSVDVFATANHSEPENGIHTLNLTQRDDSIKSVSAYSPDIIIHAGALVDLSRDFEVGKKCLEVNTVGTINLLESVKDSKPLFIYISSEEVYGNGPLPFKEDQKLDPPSPYAISKTAAEQFCLWYGKEYDFPVSIVRLGTFYGPGQPENKYFAQSIKHALTNEPIPCNSGQKKRDYIYVDDAVDLLLKVIDANCHMTVNGTGGKSYTLLTVLELIKKYTHSTSEVKIGAIPDRITERDEWLSDISRAKELLGWEPKMDLEEGLKKMVEYFRIHLSS